MNKQFEIFTRFIEEIKKDKRCIIYGGEYVILSRNVYDEIVKEPEFKSIQFDEFDKLSKDVVWIKKRFIEGK